MNELWQDVRYGLRAFINAPGFTLIAVLSIAFGIALNTSVFTIFNGMLMKPMPVRNPQQLVALYTSEPDQTYPDQFSYADYLDYRDHNQVFSELFIHYTAPLSLKTNDGLGEMVAGELVTGNYFSGLQLDAALGRLLTPEDDQKPGGHPVIVLGHDFWQRRFGGDSQVVGKLLKLNGHDYTIIGVAKKGFSGTRQFGWIPDVYIPLMMYAQAIPGTNEQFLSNRGIKAFNVNGRLRDGVTIEQARLAMSVFAEQLAKDYPQTNANLSVGMVPAASKTNPMIALMGFLPLMMGLMMGLVGLVLLVACANVANLLLARATTRRKELAVRLALGASRWRLVRQLLTESVILSAIGGALGLILAGWLSDFIMKIGTPHLDFATMDFDYDLQLDRRVLGFTLGLSLLTGIIFGLLPALQSSKPDLAPILKAEASQVTGSHWFSLRNCLVVSQVALSLILLICAGLFVRSLQNAQTMNPGFRTDHILMASTNLNLYNYDEAKGRRFYKELEDRLKALPGVEQVSFAGPLPLDQYSNGSRILIEGRMPKIENERLNVSVSTVDDNYFETLKTPIVQGRDFTEYDTEGAPRVVVINETMARHYWPNENPLGKRLRLGSDQNPWIEVVGVAQDGKYMSLDEPPTDYMFLPFLQNYNGQMTMLLHTTAEPERLAASLRSEVNMLDAQLPVYGVKTMLQYLDRVLSQQKSIAAMVGLFGFLGLLLAGVGLYGVMSYAIAQRTREIGVRMALGARPPDVLKLVLRQGMMLLLIGVGVGLIGAFALTRLLANLLYGVSPTDPMTFAVIVLLLTGVALVACLVPARRATKVDPMVALRYE